MGQVFGNPENGKEDTFQDLYEILPGEQMLGVGGFSFVTSACKKGTSEFVAVKRYKKREISVSTQQAVRQEIFILKQLDHPNIMHLLDSFEDSSSLVMVMESVNGGELYDRIATKLYYKESDARHVINGLLSAIKYIHDKNIVHRDVKPENLFLTSRTNDISFKLADFGFACYCTPRKTRYLSRKSSTFTKVTKSLKTYVLTENCGTLGYVAPEVLNEMPYGKPVDMWSIGVLMYVLLCGYLPFQHNAGKKDAQSTPKDDAEPENTVKVRRTRSENQLTNTLPQYANSEKVVKLLTKLGKFEFHEEYWAEISSEAKDLISSLLVVDMDKRLNVEEALHHPWVTGSGPRDQPDRDQAVTPVKKYLGRRMSW